MTKYCGGYDTEEKEQDFEREDVMAERKKEKKSPEEADSKGSRSHGTVENLWYWLKTLYRESPGFVWLYAAGIGVGVGTSFLGVYMPSVLVADITAQAGLERILGNLAFLGGGLACLYLTETWIGNTKQILGKRIAVKQEEEVVKLSLEASYDRVERAEFPEEFWRLTERHFWSREYNTVFMDAFAALATALTGMVLYVGMLSGLSLWILLLVLAGTGVDHVVGLQCNKWDTKNRHKWLKLDYRMNYLSRRTSTYEASKDVHLYHMPPWLEKLFNRDLKERLHHTVRQQGNYFLIGAVNGATRMVWEVAAYLYLVYLVCEGQLDAAGFVFYFGIVTGFASWCASIVSSMRKLHLEASYVEEARKFQERLCRSGEEGREELVLPPGHIPEITFSNVSFQYEGANEPTLKNLDLTMRPGENIALVGLNGAGKTTFIKLLCGFYEPTQGSILIDGRDRRQYTRESWIKYFSGVFQDGWLFPLSLRENLVMGQEAEKGNISGGAGSKGDDALGELLKMADLEEKIGKLPEGLETMFGLGSNSGAVDFSGGEMQKMMLARALGKTATLLVLDEPTAALDPLMESELYERYGRFSENKTTVFISHRLASTRFCDRILLMEKGEVAESGTHQELLDRNGKYAWMYQLQSRYYQKIEAQKEAGLEGEAVEE